MQTELTQDRPFLLCELATILAMMASAPLASAGPGTQDAPPGENNQQQTLTYKEVHGAKRLSLGGFPSSRIHWLDDDRYLMRETAGWKVISADNGDKSDWYDSDALANALQTIEGVSAADAKLMADGGWIEVLHAERIVVFRQGEQLIRTTLEGTDTAIVDGVPAELELSTLSPTGSGMAFVRNNELWVADFSTGTVRQLTYDAEAHVRNAKADWVYFEEIYNRKWQAYRWSPDGQKLAYQQFDDSEVPTFQISDHTTVAQSFEQEHYPKAGEKNPLVRLGVVSIGGGATQWIDTSAFPPDDFILTHFNWMADSATLYWYAQNRIQTWLDVQMASVHDGKSQRLMRDQTEAWVESPGDLTFLSDGSFLIFSERSGWRHLYRVSADGKHIIPVTSGDWEVRSLQAVSADESFLVVAGTKDSHIAENIYRVPLSPLYDSNVPNNFVPAAEVVRLTKEEGTHAATASRHGRYFMDTWSHLNQPPTMVLRDFSGVDVRVLEEPIDIPRNRYSFGKVELKEVPMADGSTTSAIFVYPPDFPCKHIPKHSHAGLQK